MGDKQNTTASRRKPAGNPPAKLAARRVRQAEALRENLAKRKRQGRDSADAAGETAPPTSPTHPDKAEGEFDG